MPELEGVVLDGAIDAPVLEPEPDSHEPEPAEPEPQPEPQGSPGAPGAPSKPLDPKELHQSVRASIAELRKTNSATADALKSAYYDAQSFHKEFPGGINEARELKGAIDQHGGLEAIGERMGELTWFHDLDNLLTASNPQAIKQIVEALPEQMVNLFPALSDEIETLAPDAFATWISNRFLADMNQYGLVADLQWLARVAGDNQDVKAVADKMLRYVQRLGGFAQKPFVAPKIERPQNAGGDDALARRERDLNMREFRSAHQQQASQSFAAEFSAQTAGRAVTPAQKAAIIELVSNALTRAETQADKDKMERYFQAGDRDGYLRLKKSILDRTLKTALDSAVGVTIGRKAAAKPAPGATKPGVRAPVQPQAGIKQVNAPPDRNGVDWRKTSQADVIKGLYTLKTGTQVQHRG